jgi:hypothetical protein
MKKLFLQTLLISFIFASSPVFAAETKKEPTKKTTQKKSTIDKKTNKKAEKKSEKTAKKAADEPKVVEEPTHKFVRSFDKWELFKILDDSQKTCFLTSSPAKEKGTFKKRSQPYVLVTYHGRGTPEVSISSGYNYDAGSVVDVSIIGKEAKKYEFFTSDKTPKVAWAKDSKTDGDVIKSMKSGTDFTAKGISSAGTNSEDTYSLKGFAAAVEGLVKFCK